MRPPSLLGHTIPHDWSGGSFKRHALLRPTNKIVQDSMYVQGYPTKYACILCTVQTCILFHIRHDLPCSTPKESFVEEVLTS